MITLPTLPLALPAPNWHTNNLHPFNHGLRKISDAELEARVGAQDRFYDYLLKKAAPCGLWRENYEGAREVDALLNEQAGKRWLAARSRKRMQAEFARARKKVRACA